MGQEKHENFLHYFHEDSMSCGPENMVISLQLVCCVVLCCGKLFPDVLLLASCNVQIIGMTQSLRGIQVPRAHEPFRQTTSRNTHFHAAMTVRWFTFDRRCQRLGRVMRTDRTPIASLLYQWPRPQQSRMAMCKLKQP